MDFIERLFGVSPDHGDGSLELLYLGMLAVAVSAWICRKHLYRLLIKPPR